MTGWKELDIKTKIAYITAVFAFVIGWGLTIAGFLVPPTGIISDSVLWVLGQALIYAASVFGVGMYVTGSVKGMKSAIVSFMNEEDRKYRSKTSQGQNTQEEENEDNETGEIL